MTSEKLYNIIFAIQFLFIIFIYFQIPEDFQQAGFEKKINELKFENQKIKKQLLSLSSKYNNRTKTYSLLNNTQDKKSILVNKLLTNAQISTLIEDKIKNILSDEISVIREDIIRNNKMTKSIPVHDPEYIQSSVISISKKYIDKQYDFVEDENFKSDLMLADEIIERAINAEVFTEWDADELNTATQDLDFDNRVIIMNKLSHAYNSQKIKGKFIHFNLVNNENILTIH